MRRERMSQRVRRNSCSQRCLPNVTAEQPPYAADCDALPAIVHEERIVVCASNFEIRADRFFGFRSERHDALLRSLAANFHEPRAQLDVVDVDSNQLADAKSRCVKQLEPCTIADAERR